MPVAPRLLAALVAALALPAAAAPRDDGGGCTSAAAVTDGERCDARRPSPAITVQPAAPRAGAPVVLTARSPGRGVTYAWDLDGDGAFDDATGATVTRAFAAGVHMVGVDATDEDGRRGSETRTITTHERNRGPSGTLRLLTPVPGASRPIRFALDAADPDGHVALADFDLDGDGLYELREAFAPGETVHVVHESRDVAVGPVTAHVRLTDDAGATASLTAGLQVHDANLPPVVSLDVSGDAPRAGEAVTLSATAYDPDGPDLGFAFDLDGDGTYEHEAGSEHEVQTVYATAGPREIGVEVRDDEGESAASRRTLHVEPSEPAAGNRAPSLALTLPSVPVRPAEAVELSAAAVDPDGDAVTYAWDADGDGEFDDGTLPALSFVFPHARTYRVQVRASDGHGGDRVQMRTLAVTADAGLAPVVTEFGLPPAIRAARPVTVAAAAFDPDRGGPVTLAYDLDGDGEFDDEPADGRWTFAAAEPLTVAVRATDATGLTAVRTAGVDPAPENLGPKVALSLAGAPVAGQPLALAATVADLDDDAPVSVAWDVDGDGFDDGTAAALTFTPPAPGTFVVRLRATDGDGEQVVVARTLSAGGAPPVAEFTVSNSAPAPGERVTLTSTATGAEPASQAWDLDGDGAFDDATGSAAEYTFDTAGDHLVGLKARDAGGDTGIRYRVIAVTPAPEPTATPTPTPAPGPTATPTPTPSPTTTATPTATPSPEPTAPPAATVAPTPVATVLPPPRDRTPPRLSVAVPKPSRATLLRRGVRATVRCSEACGISAVARVSQADAKRMRLGSTVELGRAERSLATGARTTVAIELSRRARSAARRTRTLRLTLTLTAVDLAGNRAVTTRRITVR